MKKILCLVLAIIMLVSLVACGKTDAIEEPAVTPDIPELITPATTEPAKPIEKPEETIEAEKLSYVFSYTVYTPNNNADGFIEENIEVNEVSPRSVLNELKNRNVLPAEVEVNHCSIDDGFVTLDFNQAFADVVCSMGTSGELMLIGSVVNTYLSAFNTDSIYFTVNGEVLESGHTVYDFEMSYFSMEN